MAYKNTLKDIITTEKIADNNIRRDFELSYETYESKIKIGNNEVKKELKSDLRSMTNKNIMEYIRNSYIIKDEIEIGKLINDLVIFKTYKYNFEISLDDDNYLMNVFGIQIAILTIVFMMDSDDTFVLKMIKISILSVLIYKNWKSYYDERLKETSKLNRLRTINNAVNILEAIKEDIYNNEKTTVSNEFELVAKRLINEKPDECLDPNHYVMFWESLEDKSN